MTKKEAAEILKRYDVNFCGDDGRPIPAERLAQAFDMAICALETLDDLTDTLIGQTYYPPRNFEQRIQHDRDKWMLEKLNGRITEVENDY